MAEENKANANKQPKGSKTQREKIYLGVIVVLTLATAVLTWQLFDSKTNIENVTVQRDDLQDEKEQLKNELNEMLDKYDELETDNEQLTEEMLAQKEQIEDLLDQVEKGKATAAQLRKYKKEVVTLRTIMKGYVVTIDSLNTLNQNLQSENQNIRSELSTTRSAKQELEQEKENLQGIVKVASRLQAQNIRFEAVKLRNSGKQRETSRADKTEIFKTCFELDENKTTPGGEKELLIRVLDSDGNPVKVIDQPIILDSGEELKASARRTITYRNEITAVCVYTNLDHEVSEGVYKVEIYESGGLIGTAELELK